MVQSEILQSKEPELFARLNESVQELHRRLYPQYFKPYSYEETLAYLSKQLLEENWIGYILRVEGREAGYALLYVRSYRENSFRKAYSGVHVDQIAILPEFKKMGLGKALMAKIEAFARERGASQLELSYWENNEEAMAFYAGLGFETAFRFVVKPLR